MQDNATKNNYFLCPDKKLLDSLIEGLATNEDRYGYGACPCRMASGVKEYDSDIICPCEYRDADVDEFGMCYCGLFVNKEMKNNPSKMGPIPERRPIEAQDAAVEAMQKAKTQTSRKKEQTASSGTFSKKLPIFRCIVCGYLCARETPPPVCPICKAKADRFENFGLDSE
jgi:ferredoxin-thioredoxin reductase catalytic subunit